MTTETKQAPETESLTDQQIAEIEAHWISGANSEEDDDVNIGALIATVKQLQREGAVLREDLKYRCESLEELRGHRDRWLTMLNPPSFDTSVDDAIRSLQSQLEQLRAENERLKNRDVVCWHCGSVLLAPSKPRCEDCPTECDVVNCDAYGCTERLVSQHLDSWK